jgi:hypothetical protein
MEVDRVSRMGGVGRESVPAWPKSALRRRKFVEEIEEPQIEAEDEDREDAQEAGPGESDESTTGELDVMA